MERPDSRVDSSLNQTERGARVKASSLELSDLLEVKAGGGVIAFGGQRSVLLDTVAIGLLRRELVERFGVLMAKGLFTRFGFAHGWRTAEALKERVPWDSERDWRVAGGKLHMLQGLVSMQPVEPRDGEQAPFAEALWVGSWEAEQHLLHHGQAEECVCWTLCGFASGYLSYVQKRDIYCVEERCVGKGDAACHMVGKPAEEWGDRLGLIQADFKGGCPTEALERLSEQLKSTEKRLRVRRHELQRSDVEEDGSGLVVRSEPMRQVVDLARRAAKVDSTVLLTGESGVGKERLARFVHEESLRATGPFVAINCGALTETLLESELFGHARGSFTGASSDRAGLFEAAQGGTLFLDEIGEVTPAMQVKLLRALQEREVRRVGENKSRKVDVRVITATNRTLTEEVAQGRFRQDLYYRLRVIELRIPPLRERPEDVLPLARVLLAEASRRLSRKTDGFTACAADQLQRYGWPGNVRELENAIERALALAEGNKVEAQDLPEEVRQALPGKFSALAVKRLEDIEKEYILAVLEANGGNRSTTAVQLAIGPATLFRKLKQYGVTGARGDA